MELPRLPPRPKKYANVYVWTFANFSETMPHPVSPMGWSLMESGLRIFMRPLRLANDAGYTLFEFLYGRVFWNLTPVFGSRLMFSMLDRELEMIAPSIRGTMKEILRKGRVRPRPIYTLPQKVVLGLQAALLIPRIAMHALWSALKPGGVERELDRLEAELRSRASPPDSDWRSSVRELDRYVAWAFGNLKRRYGPAGILFMGVTGFFASVAGFLMKSRNANDLLDLLAPSRPSKTVEADLALWELSQKPLAPDAPEFLAYLDRYGHRCPGEQDAYHPRPWDDPARAFARLQSAGGPSPAERFARQSQKQRDAAAARLKSLDPVRRLFARPLHRAASRYLPIREDGKHYVMLILGHSRRRLAAIGRGMRAEGVVADADDVFFLKLPELVRLARRDENVRERIAERREEFVKYRDVRPPLIVTSEGIPEAPPAPPLRGDGVSPGIAKGRVRVVLDPTRDGKMEPGEILVAPFTDPGWTPLFLRAAAVVTEVGGALSHGAVVAREFGLPAVVNVMDATKLLRTGETIEVDGSSGVVLRVEPINSSKLAKGGP
ncbi:MAG TPA: PEP-utilizing enzyme [Planctomycetota bacterium]|nr:PEP-utilizing enzyme [Planctomycetota bacterium]